MANSTNKPCGLPAMESYSARKLKNAPPLKVPANWKMKVPVGLKSK